ncbi:MAG: DUF4830 domain-containing protein [Oscillospiraceae bacterium]|jgi:hypothetical protein|nr:DUF4830 domain-containing protein [Oscillospiraceae bacterium]
MFVYSVKSSKIKLYALILVVAAAALALLFLTRGENVSAKGGAMRVSASNAAERLAFLSQYGWDISQDPLEVSEVMIPTAFDGTYEKYNNVQKAQGMDLSDHAGERVKRWTYEVNNFPGFENKPGVVQANLLIADGVVVGGDICSLEQGGFLQGFAFPEKNAAS